MVGALRALDEFRFIKYTASHLWVREDSEQEYLRETFQ